MLRNASIRLKFFITILLFVLWSSCVRTGVEEILWTTESVPMVYSVISPDHPVELYLGRSNFKRTALTPIPYPEARVYLCGQDSSWKELTLHSADQSIYVDSAHLMQVEKGETYSLRIELNDRTLHAQTSVPVEGATIAEASCTVHAAEAGTSNGKQSGNLTVKINLPRDKESGFYFSAFSEETGLTASAGTGIYQNNEFLCPNGIPSFTLNLITADPYFKKFRLSETINSGQNFDSDFITIITGTFGGVLPTYSNIENGVGLLGSFITDSRLVWVTTQTE